MHGRLAELVRGLGRPRIAVVGDVILDEYVWGEVERISPEAPIPVLKETRRERRPGGAGSVAVNLAVLGAEARFFSVRGGDPAGAELAALLEREGVRAEGLVVEEGRPTTRKARHVGYVQHANRAVQQLLRVDSETDRPIGRSTVAAIVERFRHGGELDLVLVPDYRKGLISAGLLAALREAAPRLKFLVDPALLEDYSAYRSSFLICPNRYEAGRASGVPCEDIEGCARAAAKLLGELDLSAVALTMDREGIYLQERGRPGLHFPTRARVVADVTGAGDMVLSVLGLVVAAGGSLEDAVELANVAAGIEVRKIGVAPVTREEVVQEILYQGHLGVGKLKTREELVPIVEEARRTGRKVVFTNGCFDLLHFGHLHLLAGAAREGDILVVAVNADASVRRLKGPGRPRIPQEMRMLTIAALEAVDYVVSFEEDTPIPLLEALRPDVLVKGEEYRSGVVVGRGLVEGYGGRVAFVSQIPGISTTALIEGAAQGSG
ncbi:MAG: bifunctional heptose 7-phosphate kinase/heptose 1-phosphate adenyltransferase [Planctomycetes bacterium]|nr:bifunctional heptose 7-phosphate kinase/heptose 1-phosphate adenyltransferase [Planctomycetota bacterium]